MPHHKLLRLIATINKEGRLGLLSVLHDPRISNLPRDPSKLYLELAGNYKHILTDLRNSGILKKEQWELLFPNNQQTDSRKFDLALCKLLIMSCTKLPAPMNGWQKPLDVNDQSVAAFVVKMIELRSRIAYSEKKGITENEYQNYWNDLEINLRGIGYNFRGSTVNQKLRKKDEKSRSKITTVL